MASSSACTAARSWSGSSFEQRRLFGGQGLALGAEAEELEMGEFEHQFLVLVLEGLNLLLKLSYHALYPGDERRVRIQASQFSE
ncbi:hypothetical protein [Chromobacterium haemolyticum]|uniref:hypothetical protein n=1 Tax=Chromobacterium haemolyticum TaxID=394935 RepID=UPI00244D08E2|nr:hypothetical protein [Chromobacterium haemolyticum]MDH0342433.1 hypothetical protein [Chromobacterium haemolyticum]